jgi:OmpA-OmpF porin, OOP family
MKRLLLASAALTILGAGNALADDGSWYIGAGVGGNWADGDVSAPTVAPFSNFDVEFDTGWAIMGDVGYRWYDSNFRLAAELAYRSNDIDSITHGTHTHPAGEDLTQFSLMVNMLFDFPIGEGAVLTLGGGLGAATAAIEAGTTMTDGDEDLAFAYQGIAGLAFSVSDNVELFGEYRYFANHKQDVTVFTSFAEEGDFDNHTATIGLRFFFGEEAEAVEPAPSAPVAPQTNFTIYFNKKGALTAEAHATITEAADVSKGGAPVVTIEAQGGGPRGGDAVARALEDLGIPAEKIAVENRDDGNSTITITN